MNLETFTKLLDSYGTVEANWPAEVRGEALAFLAENEAARSLLAGYAPLDHALDRYTVRPDIDRMRAALMAKVGRKNLFDRVTAWLMPEPGNLQTFWRPAVAATLPLILGIILGSTVSLDNADSYTDSWSDEISMVALSTNITDTLSTESPSTTDTESLP